MGYLKDLTGNFTSGLLVLGGCALVGALVTLSIKQAPAVDAAGIAQPESSH
jgi:hypothetical protein